MTQYSVTIRFSAYRTFFIFGGIPNSNLLFGRIPNSNIPFGRVPNNYYQSAAAAALILLYLSCDKELALELCLVYIIWYKHRNSLLWALSALEIINKHVQNYYVNNQKIRYLYMFFFYLIWIIQRLHECVDQNTIRSFIKINLSISK